MKRRKTNGIRVIIPDSHGQFIDRPAADAFLKDLEKLNPDEIICLGDHVDCSGIMSMHGPGCRDDRQYKYKDDVGSTNKFLDAIQKRAPNARIDYIEGNHEFHAERWAAGMFDNTDDVDLLLEHFAPRKLLKLDQRGIKYIYRLKFYDGLNIPNTIKRGKICFTHGVTACKHAAATHVDKFGMSVCFGHIHRVQEFKTRNVKSGAIGAWCPGTLAKLMPLYAHTNLTAWSHGYGLEYFSEVSGNFIHLNVPIVHGKSLLSLMPGK